MRAVRSFRTDPFVSTRLLATTALAAVTLMTLTSPAFAVDNLETPTGELVVGGSANFDRPEAGLLNIKQNTNRVVIDWETFNIGKNARTEFFQPNSGSLAVNRVTGPGDDPSQILGTLKANGNVMILDRNGVLFGPDSAIDVNGIIASTGNINVDDIMSGNKKVVLSHFGDSAVINEGTINAGEAGLVAFVAPTVVNSGVINAKLGKVALASGGESVTVDLYGDGLVEIALGDSKSKALIENTGMIDAEGGTVLMTTSAAKDVVDNIINTSGVVKVSSVEVKGGKIILSGGKIGVSGKLDASGKNGGGSIDVKGNDVEISSTATISADATGNGNGGTVNLVADRLMIYRGLTTARGGTESGNGGFAEISGYEGLIYEGLSDMTAANGEMGGILLDPRFTIIHSGLFLPGIFQQYVLSSKILALNLKTTNVTVQADDFIDVGTSENPYNLAVTGSILGNAALNLFLNALPDGNIDLSTWNTLFSSGKTAGSLTLKSDVVNFNRDMKMGKGNLTVDADTINLDGVIRGLNAAGNATVMFDESRMSSNTLSLNVRSNEARIQQAIDLAASGATVNVAAGDYAESLDVYKSLTLNGANKGLAGNDLARTAESRLLPNSPGFYVTADNVTIDGFAVDGADNGIFAESADSIILKNNVITNSSLDGIKAFKGTGITIENNAVRGVGDDAIQVEKNAGTTTISGNVISSAADEGIEVHGSETRGSGSIIISGNTVDGSIGDGIEDDGIQVAWSTTSTEITGNTVIGVHGDGIEIHSSAGGSITGNTLFGNTDQGIEISRGSDNFLVDGNTILESSREGIYIDGGDNFTVSNNDVVYTGKDGIHIQNVLTSVTVEGNFIALATEDGIHVSESGYEDALDGWSIDIRENDVLLTGNHGIHVNNSGSTRIEDNEVALAGTDFWNWELPELEEEGGDYDYTSRVSEDYYEEYPYEDNTLTIHWGNGDGLHVENVYRAKSDDGDYEYETVRLLDVETPSLDLLITGNNVRWIGGDGIDVRSSGVTEISENTVGFTGIDSTTYDLDYDIEEELSSLTVETSDLPYEGSLIAFLDEYLPMPQNFEWKNGDGIHVADTGNPDSFYFGDFSGFDSLTETDYSVRILDNTVSTTGGDGIESYYNGWNLIAGNNIDNAGQPQEYYFPSIKKYDYDYREGTGDGIRVDNGTTNPYEGSFSVTRVTGNTVVDSYEDNIHVIDVNRSSVDGNSVSFTDEFAYGENNIIVEADSFLGEWYTSYGFEEFSEYPYEGDFGYETQIVDNTSVDNAPQNGIVIDSLDYSLIAGNIISNSGANGLFARGSNNDSIVVAGNTFNDNTVGAKFESGLIDLTGETNSFSGGEVGLLFAPAIFENFQQITFFEEPYYEEDETSYAEMALVNDTIGTSTFTGQSYYYVELDNGAFFAPGMPTLLNGNDASFDGLRPGLTGGMLTQAQYDDVEAKLYHYNDDQSLGLFFFTIGQVAPGINQEDIFNEFTGFDVPNPGLRVTITGLPSLPGQGQGQQGQNIFDLASIEPAAGGDDPARNLQDIEPAAGGTPGGETAQGTDNGCWSDAIAGLSNGQPSTLDYGDTPSDALNSASNCQTNEQ